MTGPSSYRGYPLPRQTVIRVVPASRAYPPSIPALPGFSLPPPPRIVKVAGWLGAVIAALDYLDRAVNVPEVYGTESGYYGFTKIREREPLQFPPPWGMIRETANVDFRGYHEPSETWLNQQYITWGNPEVIPAGWDGFGVWVGVEDVQYGPPEACFGWCYQDWVRNAETLGDVPLVQSPGTGVMPVEGELPWAVTPAAIMPLAFAPSPEFPPYKAIPKIRPLTTIPLPWQWVEVGDTPPEEPNPEPEQPTKRYRPVVLEESIDLSPDPALKPKPKIRIKTEVTAPPRQREKEKKAKSRIVGRIWSLIGTATEMVEVIDAMFLALPKAVRLGVFRAQGYSKLTLQTKLRAIYRHWTDIQVDDFVRAMIANQIEDMAYGRLGQATVAAARNAYASSPGRQPLTGTQTGAAQREYNAHLESTASPFDPISMVGDYFASVVPNVDLSLRSALANEGFGGERAVKRRKDPRRVVNRVRGLYSSTLPPAWR